MSAYAKSFPSSRVLIPAGARPGFAATAWGYGLMLAACLLFIRLGIWIGHFPIEVPFFVCPVVVGYLVLTGRAEIDLVRAGLFGGVLLLCLVSILVKAGNVPSLFSFALFAGLYSLSCLRLRTSRTEHRALMKLFVMASAVIAVIGVAQFLLQFVLPGPDLFSWRGVVPDRFLIEYNTLNKLSMHAAQYKSNGFFLREASALSQLCARAILVTLFFLIEWWPLLPLLAGMIVAYSGTGFVLLLPFAPVRYLQALTPARIGLAVGAVVVFVLGASLIDFSSLLHRSSEFTTPNTSGYARFASSFVIIRDHILPDPMAFLFGVGPGGFDLFHSDYNFEIFGASWGKIFIEYGVFVFLAFFGYFAFIVYSSTRSVLFSAAILFHFFVLDGNLLVPGYVFLTFLIAVWPSAAGERR